ncbi:hypothetical protein [Nitrosopumilus ureiphilus]|uniref:Uncharacterized protein n=1 Tax=Nitrosopumilus ureiphilus TaxID=1470067 RepID=A0A7D5M509_9ARCH|nr:hypothetical protein [Nitrosopumilus ureiphilus]QLH06231.1 hypothetical protein C5F50_03425 [Nitrosopumilus ureiphilus]
MAIEKWLAITSMGLFVMFAGEIISVYNFMIYVPENIEFIQVFEPDPKIFQFISIGVAPAGILAAVSYIMSKQYGSKSIGSMIMIGGVMMFIGMYVSYSMLDKINENYLTDVVMYVPILFMVLSVPVISVGFFLTKQKKKRPKKEYF